MGYCASSFCLLSTQELGSLNGFVQSRKLRGKIPHLVTSGKILEMPFHNKAKPQSGKVMMKGSSQTCKTNDSVGTGRAQAHSYEDKDVKDTDKRRGPSHRVLAGVSKYQGDGGSGQKRLCENILSVRI